MTKLLALVMLVLAAGMSLPARADSAPVVAAPIQGDVMTPPSSAAQPPATDRMGVVTGDVLNVRSGPSVSELIVAKAKQGTKLHILGGPKDGWYKVRTDENIVGWVHGDYVRIQADDKKRPEYNIRGVGAVKELDSQARDYALEGLQRLGVVPLIALLKDEYWEVRRDAAVVLGHSGYRRAVDPLVACLKDKHREVRIAAAWALGRLGYKPKTEEARIAFLAAKREREQLAQEAAAVELLIACLKDESSTVCYVAMHALGKLGDARAVEPLLVAARKDKDVGYRAAHALGVLGDERAVEPLIALLKDEEGSGAPWGAAEALGKLGDTRAVEALIACLKDESGDVRGSAAGALGKLADARAVEPLIACLKDGDTDVRACAASALGMLAYPPDRAGFYDLEEEKDGC